MSPMASASLQLLASSNAVGVVLYSGCWHYKHRHVHLSIYASIARARFDAYTEGARSADYTESWSGGLAKVTSSTSCASLARMALLLARETEDAHHSQS